MTFDSDCEGETFVGRFLFDGKALISSSNIEKGSVFTSFSRLPMFSKVKMKEKYCPNV